MRKRVLLWMATAIFGCVSTCYGEDMNTFM